MTTSIQNKYDDFKKSLVSLFQNGKSQSQLCKEYGVSKSALSKWIKQYSTVQTFMYIMDLFSRKIISWHISRKADVDLVRTTFLKAYKKRNGPYGLMFHSDRGVQYTALCFRHLLDSFDVVQSFSKKRVSI